MDKVNRTKSMSVPGTANTARLATVGLVAGTSSVAKDPDGIGRSGGIHAGVAMAGGTGSHVAGDVTDVVTGAAGAVADGAAGTADGCDWSALGCDWSAFGPAFGTAFGTLGGTGVDGAGADVDGVSGARVVGAAPVVDGAPPLGAAVVGTA